MPPAQTIRQGAKGTSFEASAADGPFDKRAQALNQRFDMKVYFREDARPVAYSARDGAVFARVVLQGIPAERGLPDGEYYLWFGGTAKSPKAALLTTEGGDDVRQVEVETRTAQEKPDPARKWTLRTRIEVPTPGAMTLGHVIEAAPRRWWRLICVAVPEGSRGTGEQCARVPAN